jgi:DNA-binding GntR family transcriptional regulator
MRKPENQACTIWDISMALIERGKSLTERALEILRLEIIEGHYGFGAALSEIALAEDLGISRTPVREALARLQQEGLVIVKPQRGTFVFELTEDEFVDICDCRTVLETAAFRFAVSRSQEALAASLEAICKEMADARARDDTAGYLRSDSHFHEAFFAHSDNQYLAQSYRLISGRMAALRTHLGADPNHMEKSFREHQEIAAAAREGDIERGILLLEGHIGRKEGSYWKIRPEEKPGVLRTS